MRKTVQVMGTYAAEELDAAVTQASGIGKGVRSFAAAFFLALVSFEVCRVLLNTRSLTTTIVDSLPQLGEFAVPLLWAWLAVQALASWIAVSGLRRAAWVIAAGRLVRELTARAIPPRLRNVEQQAIAEAASFSPRPYATVAIFVVAIVLGLLFAHSITTSASISLADAPYLTTIATALLGLSLGLVVALTVANLGQERAVATGLLAGVASATFVLLLTAPADSQGTAAATTASQAPSLLAGAALRNYRIISWAVLALSAIRLASLAFGKASAPRVASIASIASSDLCITFSREHQRTLLAPVLVELKPVAFPQSVVVVYRGESAQVISGKSLIPITEAECNVLRLDQLRARAGEQFPVASAHGLFRANASVTVTPWSSESEVRPLRVPSETARRFVEQLFVNNPKSTIERATQASLDRYALSMRRGAGSMSSAQMLSRIEREHREAVRKLASLTVGSAAFELLVSESTDHHQLINRRLNAEQARLASLHRVGEEFEKSLEPIQQAWLQVREGQESAIGSSLDFEKDLRLYLATGGTFDESLESQEAAQHMGSLLRLCGITVRITDLQLGAGAAQDADEALRKRVDELTADIRKRTDEADKAFGDVVTNAINVYLKGQGLDHEARMKLIESMGPGIVSIAIQPGGIESLLSALGRPGAAQPVRQIPSTSHGPSIGSHTQARGQPIDPDGEAS